MKLSEIRSHLRKYRVGIAGAGGLGSNCAAALARSGVGSLVICDFDIVEETNLNRQFYFHDQIGKPKVNALKENLSKIDNTLEVIVFQTELNRENIPVIYKGCDIIVEAFDRAEMKEMLIETVQTHMSGIPLVVGSGMAGWGNSESIKTRKIDDFLFVCGDESTEVSDELPPLAPRVGMVSNMQANVVIDILMKRKENII